MNPLLSSLTQTQLAHDGQRLHQILKSPVFNQPSPGDTSWQPAFCEVVILLDGLLNNAEQLGHRIDFTDEVGVHGKVQDITSLVSWLRQRIPASAAKEPDQQLSSRLNCYHHAGVGYFPNGVFFRCDHTGEVTFFLDDQRIYLNRHIQRSLQEVESI
ncbi:hypothetical protein GCM10023189_11070 [Nibrella saemangeumensis]|uniref:Uncharacterized protein n=1 Tax=Nibrella saemangeumensis TaxID=1084526 RepID=A0ABP8MK04_9BACT